MSAWRIVRRSLALLRPRDRRLLGWAAVAQALVATLDLVGVLLLGLVAATATAAVTGTSLGLASDVLDSVGIAEPVTTQTVVWLGVVAGALLILKSITSLLLTRRIFRFLANRQAMLAGSIAEQLLTRPLLEVQARSSQRTSIALTTGVNAITQWVIGQAMVIGAEGSLLILLTLGLALVDLQVTLFTIVFFGLLAFILQYTLGRWAGTLGREQVDAEIDSIASVQNAMLSYREVTVTGRRGLVIAHFQRQRWRVAQVMADLFVVNQASKYVFEIGLVVGAGGLVFLVAQTRSLTAGIGIVTVFLVATSRIFPSLLRLQTALVTIRNAEGLAEPTFELVADLAKVVVDDSPATLVAAEEVLRQTRSGHAGFVGSVEVSDVSLTYPGASAPALDRVSVSLSPGHSLAIVGSTGAGKSTLSDVILGVHRPDAGQVLISGSDPRRAVQQWPGAMSYVPQDVAVLDGTVRENVGLGIPADLIDDDLAWEALERAHLADFLRASRSGLETIVGEHGVALSGGQRQRLGIARALYTRPHLIVLDEATSALDAETEHAVSATLTSLGGSVTLVIVAHRLATVRDCDQVVYLHEGRIMAAGTFDVVRGLVPDFDRQARLLGL